MSEAAVRTIPRRGRLWVIAAFAVALAALGYVIVDLSTKEPGPAVVRVEGISDAQRLFAGMPQEGDRLGSADAPVTIQIFNDIQCGNCSEDFLGTIPTLAEEYARPGEAKLLYRHYSVAPSEQELAFYAAEAAAEQGYGWQYIYLFFRNQEEAKRFGIDDEYLASIAGAVEELDLPTWLEARESGEGADGEITKRLEGYEELGRQLGIRIRQAAIVSGPNGTRVLQDGPGLGQIERAIEAVR